MKKIPFGSLCDKLVRGIKVIPTSDIILRDDAYFEHSLYRMQKRGTLECCDEYRGDKYSGCIGERDGFCHPCDYCYGEQHGFSLRWESDCFEEALYHRDNFILSRTMNWDGSYVLDLAKDIPALSDACVYCDDCDEEEYCDHHASFDSKGK